MSELQRPAAPDAERFTLGALLVGGTWEDLGGLAPEDFSVEGHAVIFRELAKMNAEGAPLDRAVLAERLMAERKLDQIGGVGTLLDLDNGMPQVFNLPSYAALVRECGQRWRMMLEFQRALLRANDRSIPLADVHGSVTRRLEAVAAAEPEHETLSVEAIINRVGLNELICGVSSSGIVPSFDGLAAILSHWRPGEVTVLATLPGMGKTTLGVQIASQVAKKGHRVLIGSKEMTADSLIRRMLAQESETNPYFWPNSDTTERRHLMESADRLAGLDLHIADRPGFEFDEYARFYASLNRVKPVRFVVLDYLQLFAGQGENRNNAIGGVARQLKIHALQRGYHLLLLSQLNREAAKEWQAGRPPRMDMLRDSGEVEQHTDNVLSPWPDREEHQAAAIDFTRTSIKTDVWVLKQRAGSTGRFSLDFIRHHTRFVERGE